MCGFLKKWFGPSSAQKRAQAEALKAQKDAAALAAASMVPQEDSMAARNAGDARMRKAMSMRGAAAAFTGGAMPTAGYGAKSLLGS